MNRFFTSLSLPALLLLGACSTEGLDSSSASSQPLTDEAPAPVLLEAVTADDAVLLARSTLDAIGKLAAIGDVTLAMIARGAPLLGGGFDPNTPAAVIAMPECNAGIEPGPGSNQLSYVFYDGGFEVPGGDALRAEFEQCEVGGLLIDGTLHIAGIGFGGDLASTANDWSFTATVVMGPIEIYNADGSLSTYTDEFRYIATRSGGVLSIDMEVGAEPDAGITGGLNAQHHREQLIDNDSAINYQFRPFAISLVDDGGSGAYTLAVRAHGSDGVSRIERYTNTPASEIRLTVANTADVRWQGGKPDGYAIAPDSGEIALNSEDGGILVTVDAGGVVLTVNDGGAVTTQAVDWAELLSTPSPWN
jgi:hypothetical protein